MSTARLRVNTCAQAGHLAWRGSRRGPLLPLLALPRRAAM